MARPRVWLRVGLVLYLGVTALVGCGRRCGRGGFYDDFPWPGHPWVAPLPAYNEHLIRDFGGMNLAMAVVFGPPPSPWTGGWPRPPWSPTWSSPCPTWSSISAT